MTSWLCQQFTHVRSSRRPILAFFQLSIIAFLLRFVALAQEEAKAAAMKESERKTADNSDQTPTTMETQRKAVSIRGMVGPRHGGLGLDATPQLSEVRVGWPE